MSSPERLDHWRASLDVVEALRQRMAEVEGAQDDALTHQLMAQVAHAKSSSFIALLDGAGRVLNVKPAALIVGGVDRAEVLGLPLWATPWWTEAKPDVVAMVKRAIDAA